MDLPFLLATSFSGGLVNVSFNPYSNGSSFFITRKANSMIDEVVSILILMDLPFLLWKFIHDYEIPYKFQSLF